MTEHKFTDEEIIRALEICQKAECWGDCEDMGCPAAAKQGCRFYLRTDEDYVGVIQDEMLKDALDLIKRQKAEIERLKDTNAALETDIVNANMNLEHITYEFDLLEQEKSVVRSEAVKEFAERLKIYYSHLDRTAGGLVEYHIGQVVKETLEGG